MIVFSPAVAAAAAVLFLGYHLYRYLQSPLRKIPGPALCGLTSLVLKWHEFQAKRTDFVHRLHLQYGPVVRIAPNEVSFASWPAVKEIYCSGGSGYDKTEFYDLFKAYSRRTMFTMLNKADHAKRKRVIADRYANSNIMKSASLSGIQERSNRFIQRCASSADGTQDVFVALLALKTDCSGTNRSSTALHSYACDCATHHLFHPHGTNCLQDPKDEDMMHQVAADDSLQNRLISHWSPTLHRLLARVLTMFAKPREIPLATAYVLDSSSRSDVATFTLMSRLEEKHGELESIDMAAECLDHMAAGIDTTGDGLCFLMWELSQPRSLAFQQKLQRELQSQPDVPFDKLSYLDAVVLEGLRCFPPIPMSLPRYVPEGGREIDGVWLPEKTVVSCQAFTLHRLDQTLFPDPDKFNPDRWLEPEGDADRRRMLFAFSNGGRGCVGKHLAIAEMKTLLRDVYSNFTTVPDASMQDESMAMSDQLISSRPVGGQCLLKFDRIAK
ncbi:cytochrome P450 [Stachybotrys elegans]|uniref:Cytochrome P450 n=1 Tax=Stachybotrys elegans TaxID=80388 RepID=A0A8K0SRL8_9HYPO|nr:cytochrome P450 [Stachybotrys elegans]